MHTIIAAVYIKVSSPTVAEAEVNELLERLSRDGIKLASDTIIDPDDGRDELDSLANWANSRTFDMVCIRREVMLEDRDTFLTFMQNLYCGNVALLGIGVN